MTLAYAKEREAFGRPIGKFQHNRFVLAEMATEARVARAFIDDCVREHNARRAVDADASMAKWWTTELQNKVVDQGVQLHGGYGYMLEYPIARAFWTAASRRSTAARPRSRRRSSAAPSASDDGDGPL